MLNPLTKLSFLMRLLSTLLVVLAFLNACATQPTEDRGVVKARPLEKPVDSSAGETETSDERALTESELDEDLSSAPISDRTLETQQKESQSKHKVINAYKLPPAKARRKQPQANSEFKSAYKDALREMDSALESNKDFSEALSMFEELEKEYPTFSGPRTNIGMIYLHLQDYLKASEAFEKALEINDENEYALSNLALSYRELGKFTEAKEKYQKAIELNPNDPLPHYNLGILAELYLRDLPLAIQSFEHYKIANGQKDPDVDNWLIDLNSRLKQQTAIPAETAIEPSAIEIDSSTLDEVKE